MVYIYALIKGIAYAFSMLLPLSEKGLDAFFYYTNINITEEGYDYILPLVMQIGVLIPLWYFLKKDLSKILNGLGSLFSDIKEKKLDLNTKEEDKKMALTLIFGGFVLLLAPLFYLLVKRFQFNMYVASLGFLVTSLLLIKALRVNEKSLKERNETVLNGMIISFFKIFSLIPGVSGVGIMYFAGLINGIKKDYTIKLTYLITFIWTFVLLSKNFILAVFGLSKVHYGLFYYILAFLGAVLTGNIGIYLFKSNIKNNNTMRFVIVNVIMAVIFITVKLRG